jgi:hypothetical protein
MASQCFVNAIRLTLRVGIVRDRDDAARVSRSPVPTCVVAASGIHVIRGMPGIVPDARHWGCLAVVSPFIVFASFAEVFAEFFMS